MCGSTSAQNTLQGEQMEFYKTLTSEYKTVFGESQGILSALTDTFKPILEAGPNQHGFDAATKNDLNTEATEGVATNYAHASKAIDEQFAAEGGGNEFLPSGANNQVKAQLAASAASQRSNEQMDVEKADYAAGRQQWQYAAGVLGGEASLLNPAGFAGAATGAGSAAGETANQIAQANNSWIAPVMGAVGGVLGGWASAGFSKPSGGGGNTTVGNSSYGVTGEQGGGIGWNQDAYGSTGGQ